jgi:hypothetical protein
MRPSENLPGLVQVIAMVELPERHFQAVASRPVLLEKRLKQPPIPAPPPRAAPAAAAAAARAKAKVVRSSSHHSSIRILRKRCAYTILSIETFQSSSLAAVSYLLILHGDPPWPRRSLRGSRCHHDSVGFTSTYQIDLFT